MSCRQPRRHGINTGVNKNKKPFFMEKLMLLSLVLNAAIGFAQLPSYLPQNGLVGWWLFNGNANDGRAA